jgi:hypothetical protein
MSDTYADYAADILSLAPRCGCLDAQPLGESKWGIKEVAYAFSSFPGGMSNLRALAVIRKAFDSWEAVCGLKFKQVGNVTEANIDIGGARGSRASFDGPNGTLAWAYLPKGANFTGRLQVRFDLDETWIESQAANGILLENVACHEIGHAIGLSHINNIAKQLLNPYYAAAISKPQSEDIRQIQTLYGRPAAAPAPTPTPAPTPGGAIYPVKSQTLMSNGEVWGAKDFVKLPQQGNSFLEW